MKKTIFFSLMLVLALGLFSCKGKENNEENKPAAEEKTEETTSQGTFEYDASYAHSSVKFEYNGFHYYIINHNSVVLAYHESYQSIRGKLVIPSKVTYNEEKYYVVCIDDAAFRGCSGLTSITIPNSVTTIGNQAFRCCSSLTSVTIPNSVTSIGEGAFADCYGLTSITIPNSVKRIREGAFCRCEGLTYVTIPNSVTTIGNQAFSGCKSLTSVSVPSHTKIGFVDAFPEHTKIIRK